MILSSDQLHHLRMICHNFLLKKCLKKIVISPNGNFLISREGEEDVLVNWQELCLFIIPKLLGIRNVIINTDSPMHPADFIIREYEKSKNPENLNG